MLGIDSCSMQKRRKHLEKRVKGVLDSLLVYGTKNIHACTECYFHRREGLNKRSQPANPKLTGLSSCRMYAIVVYPIYRRLKVFKTLGASNLGMPFRAPYPLYSKTKSVGVVPHVLLPRTTQRCLSPHHY